MVGQGLRSTAKSHHLLVGTQLNHEGIVEKEVKRIWLTVSVRAYQGEGEGIYIEY